VVKEHILNRSRQLDHLTNSFHRMAYLAIFLLFILLGLSLMVIEQYITLPIPNYFATTSDGEIIQVTAVPQ
jgi:hypothetical protein